MDPITAGFNFLGKLAELGTWVKVLDLATGDAFYASVVIGVLAVLILALWRLPKLGKIDLAGFTGKVALCAVVGLVVLAVLAFLLVVFNREIKTDAREEPPRAKRAAPLRPPPDAIGPATNREIGG